MTNEEVKKAIETCEKLTQEYFEQTDKKIKTEIKKTITKAYLTLMIDG